MRREYMAWDSPVLGRRMELLWFGHAGKPMIWFPTSKGSFYQYEDFGLVGAVADLDRGGRDPGLLRRQRRRREFLREGEAPSERIRRHDEYDRYLSEVVPFVRSRARQSGQSRDTRRSFGAYHAVELRAPPPGRRVTRSSASRASTTSTRSSTATGTRSATFTARRLMFRTWTANGSATLADGHRIVTGETDNILSGTTTMLEILNARGSQPRIGRNAPYGHDWPWWKTQIRSYVP